LRHDRRGNVEQRQLIGGTDRHLLEVRHRDAKQPDPLGRRQQRAHEFNACLSQQVVSCDRHREAAASSDLTEVGEFRLHRHGPAEGSRILAPDPHIGSHGLDAGFDFLRCGQVAFEGGFRARGFSRAIGDDRPIIFAVRDAEIPSGRFAEVLLQKDKRLRSQIRARSNAESLHLCRGGRPDAMELGNRQRRDEVRPYFRGDDELPIRLALAGRQLGEELVVRDTG
jgi:hypothetical protein